MLAGFRLYKPILILALLFILTACSSTNEVMVPGNSNGNLNNSGIMVEANDWIYFLNIQDDTKIYRFKTDGSSLEKFSDAKGVFLNAVGDSLYYINGEDQKMHKVNLQDKSDVVVLDAPVTRLMVNGKLLYYLQEDNLYSLDADQKSKKLSEQRIMNFNVENDTIYFTNDTQQLFKLTDKEEKISEKSIMLFNVQDGAIYYKDESDQLLYKMDSSTQGAQALTQGQVTTFNVTKDAIYYAITENEVSKLMKMKLDGSQAEVIKESNPMLLCISGDWMHFLDFDMNSFQFKSVVMKTDGTSVSEYPMAMTQSSPQQEIVLAGMNEPIELHDFTLTVLKSFQTNYIKNPNPDFASVIYDTVSDEMFVFVNAKIRNTTESTLDPTSLIAFMPSLTDPSRVMYTPRIKRLTDETFHNEGFEETFYLEPNEETLIQLLVEVDRENANLYLTMGKNPGEPEVGVELQGDSYFVTSYEDAYSIMTERFPEDKVEQGPGIGFKLENETQEKMFYTFSVTKSGQSEPAYYSIERESGLIYENVMDSRYPEYSIPVKVLKP